MTLKRAFDLSVALIALVILTPVLVIIAIAVKLSSPGEIVYCGTRVGRNGQAFCLYKFRSMVSGADCQGPLVTAGGDPRVTPLGRFLRRSKIDELPCLWNVVRGDMSLVGPRPENERSVALYTDEQRFVLTVWPGVTSWATLKYRNEETLLAQADNLEAAYHTIMQDKLELEVEYIRRRNFWLDLKILLQTVFAIFHI